jgi:hypothetical protein
VPAQVRQGLVGGPTQTPVVAGGGKAGLTTPPPNLLSGTALHGCSPSVYTSSIHVEDAGASNLTMIGQPRISTIARTNVGCAWDTDDYYCR